jgi:hypothetical protein
MEAKLFNTDGHDKENGIFLKLCECTYNATAVEFLDLQDSLILSVRNSGCSVKIDIHPLEIFEDGVRLLLCTSSTKGKLFPCELPFCRSGILKSSVSLAKLMTENTILSRYW